MTQRKTSTKPRRTPVSGARDIMTFNQQKAGYKYRWVNDIDNRIQRFIDAGYTFVNANDGSFSKEGENLLAGVKSVSNADSVTSGVITKNVGKGIVSYLMAIDEEYYSEDQTAKAEQINRTEASLQQGSGQDGKYGKVNIERQVRDGRVAKL